MNKELSQLCAVHKLLLSCGAKVYVVVIHLTQKKNTPFSMSCKHREAVYELMTPEQAPSLWQWAMMR